MGDGLSPPSRPVDLRRLAEDAHSIAEADPSRSLELLDSLEKWLADAPGDLYLRGMTAWSRGLALRGLGRGAEAVGSLRRALESFAAANEPLHRARVQVSLANDALAVGRVDEALALLDAAEPDLTSAETAPVEMQRAVILQRSGRVSDAFAAFDRAVRHFGDAGDRMAEAKARGNRGLAHAYRGTLEEAASDLETARALFTAEGDIALAVLTTHNLGFVAARQGNLPRALRLYDESQREARAAGLFRPEALIDRVETMLDAGLASEARLVLVSAVTELERGGLDHDLAEACLLAARAAEEDGDAPDAHRWAERAAELFAAQDRPRWRLLAEYRMLRAERASAASPELAKRLAAMADELRESGWWLVALEADAVATVLAADVGQLDLARALVEKVRPLRRRAPALARLDTWIAEARVHQATGDRSRAGRALGAAFRALDDYRSVLGSVELRTRAHGRAQRAADLGVTLALASARPDRAFHWLERARLDLASTAGSAADEESRAALAALREVSARLEHEPGSPRDTQRLRREQLALEEVLRRRERSAEGTGPPGSPTRRAIRLPELRSVLGERVLIEYSTLGEHILALGVHRGGLGHVVLGRLAVVRAAVTRLRIALGRVATGDLDPGSAEVADSVGAVERLLIEPLTRCVPLAAAAGLVIVPSGPVASVPWGALASIGHLPSVVTSSATSWAEHHRRPAIGTHARVAVIVGPDLRFARDEADAVRRVWGARARVLAGSDATASNALDALEHADLVHIAAHGSFRDDNPLLSAIRLGDGGLTGYDLKSLRRRPATIVLSACDVGMSESDALGTFGLCGLLTDAGVGTVIASVAPVVDASAPALMTAFHMGLAAGEPAAGALRRARQTRAGATDGFVCFGA